MCKTVVKSALPFFFFFFFFWHGIPAIVISKTVPTSYVIINLGQLGLLSSCPCPSLG